MSNKSWNITIGGEAGQGLVTIGESLSKCLVRSGYSIFVTQDYLSRIRGGNNSFTIRVSGAPVHSPKEKIDLLVALNKETSSIHVKHLADHHLVIDEFPKSSHLNVSALGVAAEVLGLDRNLVEKVVFERFGKKDQKIVEENEKILNEAFLWAENRKFDFDKLPRPAVVAGKMTINGNEAIALGALSAGVKFCAFYPMTPATSVPLNLAAYSKKCGIVIEQAEDEIAAINMAIGASFAGAPSMVATSGGGFALMVEAVSLSGMTETPIVIVLGQRPGPATGLPTRTEQADLEFALYSGHGEFPRAIFAPGTVEECFYLTRRAFETSEKFQTPVFILTDQYLADSFKDVTMFDLNLGPVNVVTDPAEINGTYKRYTLTKNGISPRLIPGISSHLVVADSDEHTEDGHLTEDLNVRIKMVDKRLKKGELLNKDIVQAEFFGDKKPENLFVCWGTSYGSVKEAVEKLRDSGKMAAMLHFKQVWPLDPSLFVSYLKDAKNIISVEGNATAQFAKLIRRETGIEITKKILRYDGLPITPEFILGNL